MAALPSSITVNDGSGTPVAITYTPISADKGEITFADKRKTAKAFWPKLSIAFSGETPSRKTDHVEVRAEYPLTHTVNGVEVVYATARFERGRFILPSGMPQQDRKHLRAMVANFFDVAQVIANVSDLDPMFA